MSDKLVQSLKGTSAIYLPCALEGDNVVFTTFGLSFDCADCQPTMALIRAIEYEHGITVTAFQYRFLIGDTIRIQIKYKEDDCFERDIEDAFLASLFRVLVGNDYGKNLGGKGSGLVWLKEQGLLVPDFYVIPIECFYIYKRQKDLAKKILNAIYSIIKDMGLVSVRSGAEKSLPGLMDTILNVDTTNKDNLFEHIIKVWDSYIAVPEELKEGTTGTAVIIQKMCVGDSAGVVFPQYSSHGKVSFVYRFADIGEKVVSGESEDLGEKVFRRGKIYSLLKAVHDLWLLDKKNNPPEFEVVIKGRKVYFLQIRDYKLANMERSTFKKYIKKERMDLFIDVEEETIKPKGTVYIEGKGGLFGVGVLTTKDNIPDNKDYILIVDNGVSLDVAPFIKKDNCKGVIWKVGSPHAHVGVLCRNHNKGYAKIDDIRLEELIGKEVLLFNGCIYLDTEYEHLTTTNKKPKITFKFGKIGISKPLTEDELFDKEQALREIAQYKLYLLSNYTSPPPYKYVRRMIYWAYSACLGELRHWDNKSDIDYNTMKEFAKLLGQSFIKKGCSVSRKYVFKNIKYKPLSQMIEIANRIKELFQMYDWESGYGGYKWGEVAETLYELLVAIEAKDFNALSNALNYLEHCEHNNGTFYNKFIDTYDIHDLLNKFNEVEDVWEWIEYCEEKFIKLEHDKKDSEVSILGIKEKCKDIINQIVKGKGE